MGKIKVATLGSEDEEALREKRQRQREEKKKRETASGKTHIAGMKGGERLKVAGGTMSEEEINKMAKLAEEVERDEKEGIHVEKKEEKAKKKVKVRSSQYKQSLTRVEHNKLYEVNEAVTLLRQISTTKFDSTVELHLNLVEKGLRGSVKLPHGTGKEVRVKIADNGNIDHLISEVEKGLIDFDILIAHPQVMPKLAKIARYLGPKGLMPNPKAGTISAEPEKAAGKFKGGEINWKSESDFPIIHQRIGKMSFKDMQLEENITTFIRSVTPAKITSVTLKSTMSPGIKVKV